MKYLLYLNKINAKILPKCRTNSSKFKDKSSTFEVPSDLVVRREWESFVPGVNFFRSNARICGFHFSENDIIRESLKCDSEGQINHCAPLQYLRLRNSAKPTKFDNREKSAGSLRQPLQSIESLILNNEEKLNPSHVKNERKYL